MFYQFVTDNPCLPFQNDYCNCGLATALAIMMIGRAFDHNNTSENWLIEDDVTTKAVIHNSIHFSLQFGLSNKNLLQLKRYEVIDHLMNLLLNN